MDNHDRETDGLDLIWGVRAIGKEVNLTPKQTYYVLEQGHLPAQKVGGRWCSNRRSLRSYFKALVLGELPEREA
jgi:hypothetical protein